MVIRLAPAWSLPLDAFLVSTGVVALAEIGDKTQLLAFLLAAKFRRPAPIVLGILIATLANHAGASALGTWVTSWMPPLLLRWGLGLSFLVMAAWTLVPDRLDERDIARISGRGVLAATFLAFFMAEMGDKTQVATVSLAARYHAFWPVLMGTTLGMMLANVPAVLVGDRLASRLPVRAIRRTGAAVFALLGLATLAGWGHFLDAAE